MYNSIRVCYCIVFKGDLLLTFYRYWYSFLNYFWIKHTAISILHLVKYHCLILQIRFSFAKASEAARMDWSSFTKGYFINHDTLVAVLLLIDASVPPQKIDLDCANWLGRNNVWHLTFKFIALYVCKMF